MFIRDTHQRQLLPADAYWSESQWQREIETLFLPAWHVVGTSSSLAREGDFLTCDLFGHPVIVRRMEGKLRAFLNVCSHRFCKLTAAARGNSPRLECQYHKWQFDCDGNTRQIPDAPSFRPLERGQLGLAKLSVDTCGGLVFVRVAEEGPTLLEFLGDVAGPCREYAPETLAHSFTLRRTVPANWKLILENNVESYHIEGVHGKTLGNMPAEHNCQHELEAGYSTFTSVGGPFGKQRIKLDAILAELGLASRKQYRHLLKFPNLVLMKTDCFAAIQVFTPRSACETEVLFQGFALQAPDRGWRPNWQLRRLVKREMEFWRSVLEEDFAIYPSMQQGMMSRRLPSGGLLSRREERCAHFQKYIAESCGLASQPSAQ